MNDTYFLIYTTEEGGYFHVPLSKGMAQIFEPEQFDSLIEAGTIDLTPVWSDIKLEPEKLAFVALVKVVKNHDFVLGHSRNDFPQHAYK